MSATSASTDAVTMVVDLLSGATASTWTGDPPSVNFQWDVSQQARENDPDPALYVWSPTEGALDAFDAEYSAIDQTDLVEVSCWTTAAAGTDALANDVVDFLSEYGNDNEQNTAFHRIRPIALVDNRAEKVVRRTDHYVTTVQVECQLFRSTGV